MSVVTPNETARTWKASSREPAVHLYVSGIEGDASALVATKVAGFQLSLSIVPTADWIDPGELAEAAAAVVQVDPDSASSVKRFQKLAATVQVPLIAAAYDPPLALVRSLVRAGAHDVIPLPLNIEDLESSLSPLRDALMSSGNVAAGTGARLVSVIKSVGGVGATALITQLALKFAASEARHSRDTCLLDLDLQFGDIAFQLGLQPRLSLLDLLDAGSRLDGALLRATTTEHQSGLKVVAAPTDMMPLEGLSSDQILQIVELATREFGTVFVDLPTNWANWSLSVIARADVVLLVTDLTVASVNRAKRQLNMLRSQDLGDVLVKVVVNRYDKAMARTVRLADVREALGCDVAFTVSNDFALMRTAIDRGVPIAEIKRKSALGSDLDKLDAGLAAALGLER